MDKPGTFWRVHQALEVDPQNTSTIYAVASNRIFKTTDGAASWILTSAGLTEPVTGIAIDPQNTSTLYSSGLGWGSLFESTNGAASWNSVWLPDRFGVSDVAVAGGSTTYVAAFNWQSGTSERHFIPAGH